MLPRARSDAGHDRPKARFAAQKKQGALADGEQTQHSGVFISLLDRTVSPLRPRPLAVRGPTSVRGREQAVPVPDHVGPAAMPHDVPSRPARRRAAAGLPCVLSVGEEGLGACEAASLERHAPIEPPLACNETTSLRRRAEPQPRSRWPRSAAVHPHTHLRLHAPRSLRHPRPMLLLRPLAPTRFARLQAGTGVSGRLPSSLAC